MRVLQATLHRLIVTAFLLAVWQFASNQGWVSSLFFPGPSQIAAAFVDNFEGGTLLRRMLVTIENIILGWLAASVAGVAIGAAVGSSPTTRRILSPTLEFFRPLPASALFPVAIALLGLTQGMTLIVIGFGALWPTLLATINGFVTVKPRHHEVAALLGIGRWKYLIDIALPNATPEILAGMRLSLTIAFVLTVTGEIVSGRQGLGYWMMLQARAFRTPDLFVGVFLFGLMGYAAVQFLNVIDQKLLRYRLTG